MSPPGQQQQLSCPPRSAAAVVMSSQVSRDSGPRPATQAVHRWKRRVKWSSTLFLRSSSTSLDHPPPTRPPSATLFPMYRPWVNVFIFFKVNIKMMYQPWVDVFMFCKAIVRIIYWPWVNVFIFCKVIIRIMYRPWVNIGTMVVTSAVLSVQVPIEACDNKRSDSRIFLDQLFVEWTYVN